MITYYNQMNLCYSLELYNKIFILFTTGIIYYSHHLGMRIFALILYEKNNIDILYFKYFYIFQQLNNELKLKPYISLYFPINLKLI